MTCSNAFLLSGELATLLTAYSGDADPSSVDADPPSRRVGCQKCDIIVKNCSFSIDMNALWAIAYGSGLFY